ncbi:MAG: N-formylglutamate amidohydrolase [Saprospiraceae bacterium]
MTAVILHIPHSSTKIPIKDGYIVGDEMLKSEILKLTDWYTDDLFQSSTDIIIRADFSRIFCDPERFTDDSQEVMAKYGMGVLYEKNDEGDIIRNISPELREKILAEYYWRHHNSFSLAVYGQLTQFGKALIIDCHSYPSAPLKRDLSKDPDRPDFNIGTDPYHTPELFVEISREFFDKKGYSLGIDWPYAGSIVPLEYYQKDKRVQSIMLEVNRRLYLNEPTNEKSENYLETKAVVGEYIKAMRESL